MAKNKPQQKINPQQPAQPRPQAVAAKQARPAVAATPSNGIAEKWLIIALIAIAMLVNAHTITYDYTLDDPFFTKENPFMKDGVSSIPKFFTHAAYYGVFKNHDASYRPLLLTSFAIEKQLFDFNPAISHTVNLILFALQLFLLYKLLRAIFRQYSAYIPFFIVLLFELHPIHTEVVASVKSRDEIMALLFSAACMLQTMKYVDTEKAKHLVWSAVLFFCALMSKESPVCLVLLMPLTIYFFRDVPMGKLIRAAAPYAIVAAIYMLMRVSFVENDSTKVVIMVNNNALMAATTYGEQLATALFIQFKYLVLLVFPHPLSYDYSYSQIPIIGFSDPKAIFSVLIIGALLVYALINFRKKDVFAYCILFYGMFAIITANILVIIGATMAERFVYTASLGFCIAMVFLLARLLKTDFTNISFANARNLFIIIIGIAILYSGKTIARNEAWTNNEVLYESGMETAPNSWRAQYLLAVTYTKMVNKEKDPKVKKELAAKAIDHFNKSIAILPTNSESYLLKGYAEEFGGNDDSALACYKYVVRLDSNDKQALNNWGAILLRHNDFAGAEQVLLKAVAKDTTYTDALCNLAASYGNRGMFQQSAHYYMAAIKINPNQQPNVYISISNVYRFLGDSAVSKQYADLYKKAIQAQQQQTQP